MRHSPHCLPTAKGVAIVMCALWTSGALPATTARSDEITKDIEKVVRLVEQAQTEIELTSIESKLTSDLQGFITAGNLLLQAWTGAEAHAKATRERVASLTARIAAQKAQIRADTESAALEGAIAEAKAEIAERQGRQARVPKLEAELRAMPHGSYMDAAPRERLEAELQAARRQLPDPAEIAGLQAQLQRFEAELANRRGSAPSLAALEAELEQARQSAVTAEGDAATLKKLFQKQRSVILGYGEARKWFQLVIDLKRQRMADASRDPIGRGVCETNRGPFRCTGTFNASWKSTCITQHQQGGGTDHDSGTATVTFLADGWVEVRMLSTAHRDRVQRNIGGKITSDGRMVVDRSSGDTIERYIGNFRLVAAGGGNKPTGSGTLEHHYRVDTAGREFVRCSGSLQLL